jgi:hypothetical protein
MTAGTVARRRHIALHLAHRWFAFLEAAGGDLDTHLAIFHPQVRLSGHRGQHVFAKDHPTLVAWFAAVPDAISSHHILHSVYQDMAGNGGRLAFLVAYQAPADEGVHGSIISYETQVEFAPSGSRFVALDKTPILSNTRPDYETSWASNRVLALVHAELGALGGPDDSLRSALGDDVRQVAALTAAPESARAYDALVTWIDKSASPRALRLDIEDDPGAPFPRLRALRPSQRTGGNMSSSPPGARGNRRSAATI